MPGPACAIRGWRRYGRGLLAALIIATEIGGCAGRYQPEERAQIYPENYKAELIQFLHSYINDPTKIQDAAIADPMLMPISLIVESGGNSAGSARGGGRGGGGQGGSLGAGDSNPFETSVTRERYIVCVRYNAKDRDGRYAGVKQGMAIYLRGRLDSFREQPNGPCDQAEFKPFAELEKLGR
jgi:hypothetical protein